MSPHVGNFVQDLVEMAKAMDELPKVQLDLHNSQVEAERLAQTVQDRELAIINYKQEIDALRSQLHNAEASRDDAELRFLEIEERTAQAVSARRDLADLVNRTFDLLDPPKPQPEPIVEAKPEPHHGDLEADAKDYHSKLEAEAQGQSEPDPTSASVTDGNQSTTVSEQTVAKQENADGQAAGQSNLGPYHGLRYADHPSYVTRSAWIAGSGDADDYDEFYRNMSHARATS